MPRTLSPRSSRALATWKPMNPAAPVRIMDITLRALIDEFNPEPVGWGNFPYLFVVPPTRAFVSEERALGVGRDVPAGTPAGAAKRSATASAPTELQGFPLPVCPPP